MANDPRDVEGERRRRANIWSELLSRGGPERVPAEVLRDLAVYGGASGIWVNNKATGPLTPDGHGVAVSVLHNGSGGAAY